MLRYDGNIILSFLKCDIKHDQPPSTNPVVKITDRLTSLETSNKITGVFLLLLVIAFVCNILGYFSLV